MLQSRKPIRRAQRQAIEERRFLDPAAITARFYGMILTGDCMHPTFKDGEKVIFDREAPLENGCFANFFYRPELVPQGELGIALKKIVFAPPPWVTFPWREHPNSEVRAIILVEQFNPRQQWSVRCDALLAMHRCLGSANDPEVQWQARSGGMADMSNVVAFRKREQPLTGWMLSTVVVQQDRPLKLGEMVAFQFFSQSKNDWDHRLMFARWEGPTGRDERGRFVRKGAPNEHYALDCGLKYRPSSGWIRILGKVIDNRIENAVSLPRPPASE